MNFISKIFSSKPSATRKNEITIYLDSDCKRSIETNNQSVETYHRDNQFQIEQFLYVSIKARKTGEIVLKRKLNGFEFLADVLAASTNEEYKAYLIVGYTSDRNAIPKINSVLTLTETLKFIRSGTLQKYSESHNSFEECQLKLHHDYLTYYKLRSKEKKVSFMPLENASVEMIDEKKKIFTVKDKFKSIMFKTTSKEDMIGWLLAISDAIRIRNAQIYMNQLDEKMNKKIKDKLNLYCTRCSSLRQNGRSILLDEIGRKSLREYFKKNQQDHKDHTDIKMLSFIETYLYMCKVRREKGEQDSQSILISIKEVLNQLRESLPQSIRNRNFDSKQDLIKAIEEIMRYLDEKYKKILLEKKYLHATFQGHMLDQYKQGSRIQLKTLYGVICDTAKRIITE